MNKAKNHFRETFFNTKVMNETKVKSNHFEFMNIA